MQNKLFLSEIDKKYQELLETLSPEQEEGKEWFHA